MKKAETILQSKIIAALCQNGCYARNHTVGNFFTQYGGRIQVGTPGESDIDGFRFSDGKAIYIEVKLPGEHPRPEQQRFLDAMSRHGAITGCAHSVEEAVNLVNRDSTAV